MNGSGPAAPERPDQPELSFSELVSCMNQLGGRVDLLWQRVIYAHAALAAVMTFFASNPGEYLVPRLAVLFVYTANSVVSYQSFDEAYRGLDAAAADVKRLSGTAEISSDVLKWAVGRSYRRHRLRRGAILALAWVVVAYLLFHPVVAD